jgi:hypothetical protein
LETKGEGAEKSSQWMHLECVILHNVEEKEREREAGALVSLLFREI